MSVCLDELTTFLRNQVVHMIPPTAKVGISKLDVNYEESFRVEEEFIERQLTEYQSNDLAMQSAAYDSTASSSFTHTYVYKHTQTYTHKYTKTWAYTSMYTHTFRRNECMYIYTFMYIYMHMYTQHTYRHIHSMYLCVYIQYVCTYTKCFGLLAILLHFTVIFKAQS